jgi:hypothetical protein
MTTMFVTPAATIDASDPRFMSMEPSPMQAMTRKSRRASARPSPIDVPCPMLDGTSTRSSA